MRSTFLVSVANLAFLDIIHATCKILKLYLISVSRENLLNIGQAFKGMKFDVMVIPDKILTNAKYKIWSRAFSIDSL